MYTDGIITIEDNSPYVSPNGTQYPWNFPKSEIPNLEFVESIPPTPEEIQSKITIAKIEKNVQINEWRANANRTYFTHLGKQIACDSLSRSDIDAVAGSISLTGAFPVGFPNAWKAIDNSYIPLANVDAFKNLYGSMTLQGTINFEHSQTLKTNLVSATTLEEINAIVW